jgi:RNA polymerase sigma factor (sigma-70 family)
MGLSSIPGYSDESIHRMLLDARRIALRWCRSSADAEDVAQEAVIRLMAAKETPQNIPAWLYVVTRRLCNRVRLRDLARRLAEEGYDYGVQRSETAIDLRLDVERILSRLGTRDRRLMLRVLAGEVSSAIAVEFGCRERDVGQMVARVRRKARLLRHRR